MNVKITFLTFLYCYFMIFNLPSVSSADSEDTNTPLKISIATIRTEAEKAALGIITSYLEEIDEEYLLSNTDPKNINPRMGWLFDISPEVEMQLGDEDSFNGITAKLTGNYIRFMTSMIADIITPCSDCFFHAFPVSFGFESDRNFENISALLEGGYVPFYLKNKWKLGLKSKIGLYVQAGYKFEIDDTPEVKDGGAAAETEEVPDSKIIRIKFDAGSRIDLFSYSKGDYIVSLDPRVRFWYDLVNSETYHKYDIALVFSLGKNKSFNLRFEDGSGAPNFNEGEQFSANISVNY